MHPTTLLAHYGLTPLPRPTAWRRIAAAPRRRPLRGARRAAGEPQAARQRLSVPERVRSAATGWRGAVAALLVAVAVGGLGVLRVWPPFAVVMSGSMAPTINTGDMVVLERLRAPARIGQIVAVDVPDAARARYGYPPVVIHRVFRITPDGQMRTKGDARPAPDPFTVPRTAVDTRVVARIPSGGRVLAFFGSAPGLLWLAFGGLLFFGLPVVERQREARRRDTEATADLREELVGVAAELARLHSEEERSRAAADATLSQLDRLTRLVERSCSAASACPTAEGGLAEVAMSAARASGPDGQSGLGDSAAERAIPVAVTAGEVAETMPQPQPPVAAPADIGDATEPAPGDAGAAIAAAAVVGSLGGVGESPVRTESPVLADPLVADLPVAGVSVVTDEEAGPAVAALVPAAAPDSPGAVFVLTAAPASRAPAVVARWDEPPCAAATSATGWAAAPAATPTRRFTRAARLVAASHA
jgi:signal peptidase I